MKVEFALKDTARSGTGAEDDTTQQDLRSLHKWLHDARREHRGTIETAGGRPGTGEMGTGAELIVALVSTGAALVQLVLSVDTWRLARRPPSQIVIHVHGADPADLDAARRAAPELTVLAADEPDEPVEPEEGEEGDDAASGDPEGDA